MSADLKWLQGKIVENSNDESPDLGVLMSGLLKALVAEQVQEQASAPAEGEQE